MAEQRYGSITPEWVFEAAIDALDGRDDLGDYKIEDNDEYRNRTLTILNDVCQELYKYSDTCDVIPGRRPVCPLIVNFTDPLGTDDHINKTLLPDALCARLLVDENPSVANYYQQEYERKLLKLISDGIPGTGCEDVIDVYGADCDNELRPRPDSYYWNWGPIW